VLPELYDFYCSDCPWLIYNSSFNSNVEKLKCLQRFCRNNLKYWRFRRWIKTREFAEWFYSPKQWGGRSGKREMKEMLALIAQEK